MVRNMLLIVPILCASGMYRTFAACNAHFATNMTRHFARETDPPRV